MYKEGHRDYCTTRIAYTEKCTDSGLGSVLTEWVITIIVQIKSCREKCTNRVYWDVMYCEELY